MRPVKDSRSSDSRVESVMAMRSIIDNRVGAERRIESRMCVPTLDLASKEIALSALSRLLRSLRRKVRFEDCGGTEEKEFEIGMREACRICDVVVQSARLRSAFGERLRRPSCTSVHAGPGMMSMA